MSGISCHRTDCDKTLGISQIKPLGHVGKLIMNCENGHTVKVNTSSHKEGGNVANLRIIHGAKCSGLRHIQFERFYKATGMGICRETMFSDVAGIYCKANEDAANEILEGVVNIEIGQVIANSQDPPDYTGIDIITDAWHGTRQCIFGCYSARGVIALGGTTHKVVSAQVISKQDGQISQLLE